MDKQLLKYTNLLFDLYELIADGKLNSDEADVIRDQLEGTKIPVDTPQYIHNLSGDLYMIMEEDMYFALPEGATKKEYLLRLDKAVNANQWGEVLELLTASLDLERALIAEYRGRAWKHLGNERVSEAFLSYAIKLRKDAIKLRKKAEDEIH